MVNYPKKTNHGFMFILGVYWNPRASIRYEHLYEELYVNKHYEFHLYIQYGQYNCDDFLLSFEEAKKWFKGNLKENPTDIDFLLYKRYFGDREKGLQALKCVVEDIEK